MYRCCRCLAHAVELCVWGDCVAGVNCAQFFAPAINDSGWDEVFHDNTCYMQSSGESAHAPHAHSRTDHSQRFTHRASLFSLSAPCRVLDVDACDLALSEVLPHAWNNTVRRHTLPSNTFPLHPRHLAQVSDVCVSVRLPVCAWVRQYYFPNNVSFSITCSSSKLNLFQWQSSGYDRGSVQAVAPPLPQIIDMARSMLGLGTPARSHSNRQVDSS